MPPNLHPAMRHGKNRLVEMAPLHRHVPSLLLAADLLAGLGDRPTSQLPSGGDDTWVALFEKLVLLIENSNAMKKRLNAYHQHCRINPDDIEVVSDGEQEDPMPDITNFLSLPHTIESEIGLHPSAIPPDTYLPSGSLPAHTGP